MFLIIDNISVIRILSLQIYNVEEETRRFQTRESIGTCPVCGSLVYESKTNFYCSNHDCHFALWKDNRYLQSMEKTMDKKMAAELLKSGCVHVKDLYSRKKNMYFEADLHMDADETGRVNFSLSFPKKKPKNKVFKLQMRLERTNL